MMFAARARAPLLREGSRRFIIFFCWPRASSAARPARRRHAHGAVARCTWPPRALCFTVIEPPCVAGRGATSGGLNAALIALLCFHQRIAM